MIENLLGKDEISEKEETEEKNKPSDPENAGLPAESKILESEQEFADELSQKKLPQTNQRVIPFEIDHPIGQPKTERETSASRENAEQNPYGDEKSFGDQESLEKEILKIERELEETKPQTTENTQFSDEFSPAESNVSEINKPETKSAPILESESKIHISHKPFTPDSPAETVRKTGLAFSAGISLFGSVVFMLIIGWFVDLYAGSGPWGKVAGILLGALIGFIQFFRISRQILNPPESEFKKLSLFADYDDPDMK